VTAAKAPSRSALQVWQLEQIEGECALLQGHAADPGCPCQSETENCVRKHLLTIEALAKETYAMVEDENEKQLMSDLADQARAWRKHVEQLTIGSSEISDADSEPEPPIRIEHTPAGEVSIYKEQAEFHQGSLRTIKPDDETLVLVGCPVDRASWSGTECVCRSTGERGCMDLHSTTRLTETKKKIGPAAISETPIAVMDPFGSRCRDPETGLWIRSELCGFEPVGILTSALGMDGLTQYQFDFRIVSLDNLIVSHNPFTFEPNSLYPPDLQPRLRERAATKIQVEKIAANLEPDALLTDFHTLDRGAPIIGPDMVVEAGNGRVMAIIRAAKDYPGKYREYQDRLRERISDFGLKANDLDIERPVLVRSRISDVNRVAFTQEANAAATLAPSAIENARTDAEKITVGMLGELVVSENESIEDALRATRNQPFATRFLKTLPENVQASLVDAKGYLNRDGVHRMAMAIFVSAFQGDTGLRLAEKAFESVDMDVRNAINAIARSIGLLAQAESLIRSGERDTKLSIGDDLAHTIVVYSAIKHTPELTVEKYLKQGQLLERELTDFQEQVLIVFDQYRGSPKKLGSILSGYASMVIDSPPPAQAALLPDGGLTKNDLWSRAQEL